MELKAGPWERAEECWMCNGRVMNGLDIKALREHVAKGHYLAEFPEGRGEGNRLAYLLVLLEVV
eukprot:1159360-Pelagomonas_calceolata.AAC.5